MLRVAVWCVAVHGQDGVLRVGLWLMFSSLSCWVTFEAGHYKGLVLHVGAPC